MSVLISTGPATKKVAGNWNVWSASKLIALYECPLAFQFRYFQKLPHKQHPLATFGSAIHYMFHRFFQVNYKSPDTFAGAWRGYWIGVCEGQHGSFGFNSKPVSIDFRDSNQIGSLCGYGEKIVRAFYTNNTQYRQGDLRPSTEVSFRVNFEGYTLRGQMDRIQPLNGGSGVKEEIWDYKPKLPQPDSLRHDIQMIIYDLGYQLKFGRQPAGIRIYDYKTADTLLVKTHSEQDFHELLNWIKEAHAYLWTVLFWKEYSFLPEEFQLDGFKHFQQTDIECSVLGPRWFPNSPRCQFCPFIQQCEKWRQQIKPKSASQTIFAHLKTKREPATTKQLELFVGQSLK